jgi:sulfonate transport system substrate-binding protein
MIANRRLSRRAVALHAPIAGLAAAVAPRLLSVSAQESETPDRIRLDYAYYNPSSLVLREYGWIEEIFADAEVEWVLSAGSNKANEYLRSDAVDFGSTAGAAALLARANGSSIKAVYLYSQPEWTALVVPAESEIASVAELDGRKIAATKGTDPYFFLLRSLDEAGLSGSDVEVVNLQHADGKVALERGDVEAWAGLDPYMAQTELEAGSQLIYRNIDFNSYGFLNARESFLERYPEATVQILEQYERARLWILENPDETIAILANEASLSEDVARVELVERTILDFVPIPGEATTATLEAIIPIFEAENQLQPGADAHEALATLYDTTFIDQVYTPAE